jgi:hypothetical protein
MKTPAADAVREALDHNSGMDDETNQGAAGDG